MRAVLVSALILGVALVLMLGTVQVLPAYNVSATYRCSVIVEPGHAYSIRVIGSEAKDFSVSQNGQVTIEVPRLPRSCSWVCFGVTLRDGSPHNRKAIHVLRDGQVIRRLSLRQLERLGLDESGAKKITL